MLAAVFLSAAHAHAVTMDWVVVGNPGNANSQYGYGAVALDYQIGKYEVTIGQYAEFLNAVAKSDPYSLYNSNMGTNLNVGGISQSGSSGNYAYSVMTNGGNSANRPITYVSWFDAARFANWMHNGQGNGDTETGAYTLVNGQTSGTAPARNPGAQFFIPTENQWYKAAYYQGPPGNYAFFATTGNTAPGNTIGSGANQANYYANDYAVTQSASYSSSQNYLTDVGAFTSNPSFYGTFDQSGNVYEWNDLDGLPGTTRGKRGGSWGETSTNLSMAGRPTPQTTVLQENDLGFRLAAPIPEPSTAIMALAGLACGGFSVWRRRRRQDSGRSSAIAAALALGMALLTAGPAQAVTIDWVTVGDPGNAASISPAGFGAVADPYQIMKFEWTNMQYVDFLNAVDPSGTNPNSIYNLNMGSNARGGISFNTNGTSGSKYAAKTDMGDKPVNYVTWFDAARVANWLNNGQGSGDTETGAYTLNGVTSGTAPARNAGAQYWVPTENQWFKAAYYKGSGTNAGYWSYATQTDTAPTPVTADSTGNGSAGSTGNFANFVQVADWNSQNGNVTTVGTNGGPSAYTTFDMSGNVAEWNDLTAVSGTTRGMRGGSWIGSASNMISFNGFQVSTSFDDSSLGFRLASPVTVPEPATCALGLAGLAGGGYVFRRRCRRA